MVEFKSPIVRQLANQIAFKSAQGQYANLTTRNIMLLNTMHRNEVIVLGTKYLHKIQKDILSHDYTKISYFDEFIEATFSENSFKTMPWWYKIHLGLEPHHALDYKGVEKINLGHFIHMASDWICAGIARSKEGKFEYHIKPEKFQHQLVSAFKVTIDEMLQMIQVIDLSDDKYDENL